MSEKRMRTESDSMGQMQVPADALWGAQTQRAVENFPVSGIVFPRSFVRALGLVKKAAAQTNIELGQIPEDVGVAVIQAADEVIAGKWDAHFVLDIFQTGSGTSTNMNANEVIATRATQILGGRKVHPNDHVNAGQSSNDVIPTCIHLAALETLVSDLLPALESLAYNLENKEREFHEIIKIGRTHLQDATPIRLGQEFSGYAAMVRHGIVRLNGTKAGLRELALGGTAVGTGINAPAGFASKTIARLAEQMGIPLVEATNHFEAQGSKDAAVETSGQLKTLAVSLMKIANDIRWLGSGPRCGIGELLIPAVQPGSSIMPGKVNPVMAESLIQVCAQVVGNDAAVTLGGAFGNFELNVMMPLIAHNLLQSIQLLANASRLFDQRCIAGLKADKAKCEQMVEQSLAMVTSLSPLVGYDRAAALAKEAYSTGRTIRELVNERGILDKEVLDKALDPLSMVDPA